MKLNMIQIESYALLDEGHKEILQSECYKDYGVRNLSPAILNWNE